MTPAEEDALMTRLGLGPMWRDEIRLAIRAAVAAERERAARVCEKTAETALGCQSGREDYLPNVMLRNYAAQATDCAAAIRRGD